MFGFQAAGRYEGGGWRIDILHTQVPFFRKHPAEVEAVVNFTVPFELPDGGSGMDFEHDGTVVNVPYARGVMLFTEGEYRHQIAALECCAPAQRRITCRDTGCGSAAAGFCSGEHRPICCESSPGNRAVECTSLIEIYSIGVMW